MTVAHRVRWFARIPVGSPEAPDGWLPRTAVMAGAWGWDVRCSCGQETRMGGGTERCIRRMIWEHREGFALGGWYPAR